MTCSDFVTQGDVVEKEFVMGRDDFGSELGFDIIPVVEQFVVPERESEADSFAGSPPSGTPFRGGGNALL